MTNPMPVKDIVERQKLLELLIEKLPTYNSEWGTAMQDEWWKRFDQLVQMADPPRDATDANPAASGLEGRK